MSNQSDYMNTGTSGTVCRGAGKLW